MRKGLFCLVFCTDGERAVSGVGSAILAIVGRGVACGSEQGRQPEPCVGQNVVVELIQGVR